MRLLSYLNRFGKYLRGGPQRRRPEQFQSRPRIEELESRMLLSTLNLDAVFAAKATYTAGAGVANNLTLSEQVVVVNKQSILEHIFTDTAEKITVTGPGAV